MKKAIEFLLVACLSVTFVSAILYAYFLYEEKELLQNEVELKQNIIDKYHERDSIMRKVDMGADSKVETVNNKMTVTLSFKEKQIEN